MTAASREAAPVSDCARDRPSTSEDPSRIELVAGAGVGVEYEVVSGSNPPDAVEPTDDSGGERRLFIPISLSLGVTHAGFAFALRTQLDVGDDEHRARRLEVDLAARCACWRERYQWRIGIFGGYDLRGSAIAAGVLHRSQWTIYRKFFAGLEIRLGGVVDALGDGRVAASAQLGLFLGQGL